MVEQAPDMAAQRQGGPVVNGVGRDEFDSFAKHTTRQFDHVNSILDRIVDKLDNVGRVPPGAVFGGLSVLISALLIGGALVKFSTDARAAPVERDLSSLKQQFSRHQELAGHSEALIKHARTDERMRSMLDELDGLAVTVKEVKNDLRAQDAWFHNWVAEHDQIVSALNARQDEAIRNLQERADLEEHRLHEITSTRWTSEMGSESRDRITAIERHLSAMDSTIRGMLRDKGFAIEPPE